MSFTEWEHIDWIRGRLQDDPRVLLGIGDDAAVVRVPGGELLVTVDMLIEGIHFDSATTSAGRIGRKALGVNLSDVAAMAGKPHSAVIAVALPSGRGDSFAKELFEGIHELAEEFDVAIVGGDTNRSSAGLVVSITVLALPTGRGPICRSGARPGDILCVTGRLGYSLGGKHLSFTPRVREAQFLHEHYELRAMIDLSDGLGGDIFHLADESGVGAILEADGLPIADPAGPGDDRTPLDHALADGEDFELLFALAPGDAERLLRAQPFAGAGTPITRVGVVTEACEVQLRERGELRKLCRGGFTHAF